MRETLVLRVDPRKTELKKIRIAAGIIRKGGLVAFPTETVYGLGADALNPDAVLTVFEAKRRPLDNPPIVHIENIGDVYRLAEDVPERAEMLMKRFWPGPLTLIFKHSRIVPDVTVANLDTIAVRMPDHKVALSLIRESGCPIAAPSANLSGRPSPTSAQHVLEDLNGRIDAILDAGPTQIGVESTVLDFSTYPPQILRPGGLSFESLKKVIKDMRLHPVAAADKELPMEKARSPGMVHKHYAPNAKVIVVEGKLPSVISKVNELAKRYRSKGSKVGVLATDETRKSYEADIVKSLGSRHNLEDVAKNLFRFFRELDAEGIDVIIAEGVPTEGIGLAVMNRLRKSSGYNIVRV